MKRKNIHIILIFGLLLLSACSSLNAQGMEMTSETTTSDVSDKLPTTTNGAEPLDEAVLIDEAEKQEDDPDQQDTGSDPEADSESSDQNTTRPEGWSDETHSKASDPDYETVFPQDQVNRLDISIDPDEWALMMTDMTELYGEFGVRGSGRKSPRGEPIQPPEGGPSKGGVLPPQGGARPGGMMEGDDSNPVWVTATVEFGESTWNHVGVRFKGNSSLFSSWQSGILKLPLKLDFDEFENEYPEIDDQRFYGFKQLSLASNFNDDSFLREKATADIFREAGLPAAQTAFYQVYIDYGEGSIYFGLYTMAEVVDDTLIETQFSDDGGNLYKPSGQGASFASGSFNQESFDKETNQDETDWSDVKALHKALHAGTRTTDPSAWRAGLEAVFDVDGFLNWLAVNTVVQNWDSYGMIGHNYYLYNDPETGLLTWIPWDHNEAMRVREQRGILSLSMDEVKANWPLIRFLMDDPTYQEIYTPYVEAAINGPFNPEEMEATFQELHDLVRPYVIGPDGEIQGYTHLRSDSAFEKALDFLVKHAYQRYEGVSSWLGEN